MDVELINKKTCLRYPEKSNKINKKEEILNCIELVQSANKGNINSRRSYEANTFNNQNSTNNNNNISLNNSFNNSNTIQNNINSSLSNNNNIFNFDRVFPEYTNQEEVNLISQK